LENSIEYVAKKDFIDYVNRNIGVKALLPHQRWGSFNLYGWR
jgi:hypothetical protein